MCVVTGGVRSRTWPWSNLYTLMYELHNNIIIMMAVGGFAHMAVKPRPKSFVLQGARQATVTPGREALWPNLQSLEVMFGMSRGGRQRGVCTCVGGKGREVPP